MLSKINIMKIKYERRHFFKKILISLFIFPILKLNIFSINNKNFKLIKRKNLIWYLNNND